MKKKYETKKLPLIIPVLCSAICLGILFFYFITNSNDKPYSILQHDEYIIGASYSSDGSLIATSGGNSCTLYIWDVSIHERIIQRNLCVDTEMHTLGNVFYAPNDAIVVTEYYGNGIAYFVEGNTGEVLQQIEGYVADFTRIDFSTDGSYFATGGIENTVDIRRMSDGQIIMELSGHTNRVTEAEFSPNGVWIATSSRDNTARIWDFETGNVVAELVGHTRPIMSISFSPDSTQVVTSSFDGTARVWDITTGDEISRLSPIGRSGGYGVNAEYSPDGKYIITGDWFIGLINIWDANTGLILQNFEHLDGNWLSHISYSPNGQFIISVSGTTVRIWDTNSVATP